MDINSDIFKAYDIRGVFPDEIDATAAYRVGRAMVRFTGARTVAVGRDMRKSGIELFRDLARGITDQGADVLDIGMCTTPMLSFAVAQGNDAGIMISASHNPSQYNAFKLIKKPSEQLSSDTGILDIQEMCEKDDFKDDDGSKGRVRRLDILPAYISHILGFATSIKGLKVVVDYGNGVGAISTRPVFDRLDIEAIHLYADPDGTFPNHPANPHDLKNMDDVREKVKKEKANLGIFYDGDADRSIIIDEKGEIVPADILLGLLAVEELDKHPNEKVYYDLRFSKAIREEIDKAGGNPVMMKVGNPFYKSALIHKGGIIAGELSGHVMYKDNYCIDDGLFCAVKVMDIMCTRKRPISELVKPFRRYFQSEEINRTVPDPRGVLKKVASAYKDGRLSKMDGVRVEYSDWWFSLRMSNTEPLVRLRIEADTAELLSEKRHELMKFIEPVSKK